MGSHNFCFRNSLRAKFAHIPVSQIENFKKSFLRKAIIPFFYLAIMQEAQLEKIVSFS